MNGDRPKILEKKYQPPHTAVEEFEQADSLLLGHYKSIRANSGQAVPVFCVTMVLLGKLLLICFSEESTLGLTPTAV